MFLLISLCSGGVAADPKNCAETNELSKSHAFQMFGGTLLVCVCVRVKVLTSFPENYGRIIFFQVQKVVIAFTTSLRFNKRNV